MCSMTTLYLRHSILMGGGGERERERIKNCEEWNEKISAEFKFIFKCKENWLVVHYHFFISFKIQATTPSWHRVAQMVINIDQTISVFIFCFYIQSAFPKIAARSGLDSWSMVLDWLMAAKLMEMFKSETYVPD